MILNETAPAAKAVKLSEDGHFYEYLPLEQKWTALYTPDKPFTLREARKAKAEGRMVAGSITTIFKVLAKDQLTDWKIEQALLVAARVPFNPEAGSLEDWVNEVSAVASRASMGAATLGTQIHAAFENAIVDLEYDAAMDVYMQPTLAKVKELRLEVIASEVCVGDVPIGVAGRTDLICADCTVVDLKSRKTKPNRKAGSYSTDCAQLAFYGYCYFGPRFLKEGRGIILVISTTEPGRVNEIVYGPDDLAAAFEAFLGMVKIWKWEKKW